MVPARRGPRGNMTSFHMLGPSDPDRHSANCRSAATHTVMPQPRRLSEHRQMSHQAAPSSSHFISPCDYYRPNARRVYLGLEACQPVLSGANPQTLKLCSVLYILLSHIQSIQFNPLLRPLVLFHKISGETTRLLLLSVNRTMRPS